MPKVFVVQPNQKKIPEKKLLKDFIRSITTATFPCHLFQWSLHHHLCLTRGEETPSNTRSLSCKVCTFSLCCVPFTSKNSLQVKFSQILNEWSQTADDRALQRGNTWQRAAAWEDMETQTRSFHRQTHAGAAVRHSKSLKDCSCRLWVSGPTTECRRLNRNLNTPCSWLWQ